jgi:hypothetical protein
MTVQRMAGHSVALSGLVVEIMVLAVESEGEAYRAPGGAKGDLVHCLDGQDGMGLPFVMQMSHSTEVAGLAMPARRRQAGVGAAAV